MKPAPFEYHRPRSVDEAVRALADSGGKVLAGGQSLVPLMSMRLLSPPALVDINAVTGLDAIEVTPTGVRVGALVRHADLLADPAAGAAIPLLRAALLDVAHAAVRSRGTPVGSLVHADPAAELPAVLRLLGGEVEVVSAAEGSRLVPAAELFVGPLETALRADELAVAAVFERPPFGTGTAWLELSRRHGDYAIVGVAARVARAADGTVSAAAVVLSGVGGVPCYVDLNEALGGADRADPDRLAVAAGLVRAAVEPDGDIHASADYRRHLCGVLSARALDSALDAAPAEAA